MICRVVKLVVVEDDPGAEGINQHQTRVDERRRKSVTLQMIRSNNPSLISVRVSPLTMQIIQAGKIGTENIDRRRAVTQWSNHEDQCPD
jgi:hypothetical protein